VIGTQRFITDYGRPHAVRTGTTGREPVDTRRAHRIHGSRGSGRHDEHREGEHQPAQTQRCVQSHVSPSWLVAEYWRKLTGRTLAAPVSKSFVAAVTDATGATGQMSLIRIIDAGGLVCSCNASVFDCLPDDFYNAPRGHGPPTLREASRYANGHGPHRTNRQARGSEKPAMFDSIFQEGT
jgi:hypothetical protein